MTELGTRRALRAGEVIFEQGAAADGAYVLVSGYCHVIRDGEHITTIEPGQVFGEMGVLGEWNRSATIVSVTDSEVLFLDPDEVRASLTSSPELFLDSFIAVVTRLHETMGREVVHRDEHYALADVQRSLLPDLSEWDEAGFDVAAAWRPASRASGDIYDVIRLADGRVLFWLGDVMGHGAAAALTTAVADAQVKELARTFRRVDELLLRLDGYLRDNAPRRYGMSLVAVALDPETGTIEYGAAGHPPPLLHRAGQVTPLELHAGVVLGTPFVGGRGYQRHEDVLEPGDALLLYTDGLYELPIDDEGTMLGKDGLARVFGEVLADGSADALDSLVERIEQLDTGMQDDDRTALLITVPERVRQSSSVPSAVATRPGR